MNYSNIKIKVCGLTNVKDVNYALDLNVDYLGFIFAESKRKINVERFCEIKQNVDLKNALTVGVFMDTDLEKILEIDEKCNFDFIQLHGNENIKEYYRLFDKPLIKRVTDMKTIELYSGYDCYLLFDKTVLNNQIMDLIKLNEYNLNNKFFIAGGLNCTNIEYYLKNTDNIYGVDVSSGIEKYPGKKDIKLMKKFVNLIKN